MFLTSVCQGYWALLTTSSIYTAVFLIRRVLNEKANFVTREYGFWFAKRITITLILITVNMRKFILFINLYIIILLFTEHLHTLHAPYLFKQ